MVAEKKSTYASDFQIDLETWRQLCGDARSRAKSESALDFTHDMMLRANQYGLRAFVSETQMDRLCKLADRVPVRLKAATETTKIAYVKTPQLVRYCCWPGCEKRITAEMWACVQHWRYIPDSLRTRLWKLHEPGKPPSPEYSAALADFEQWIRDNALAGPRAPNTEGLPQPSI